MCAVEVKFLYNLSIDETKTKIFQIPNIQLVTWYIGVNGFKKAGADFYKSNLIDPALKHTNATLWLIDLTAWGAFKGNLNILSKESSCVQLIRKCLDKRGAVVTAKKIFSSIISEKNYLCINLIQAILRRSFVFKKSLTHRQLGITVKDLFGSYTSAFNTISNVDISKAYSAIQYLECLYIVKYIVHAMMTQNYDSDYNIAFVLPNDEIGYYDSEEHPIAKDIEYMLKSGTSFLNNINIYFVSYSYGNRPSHRPYNAPGAVINSKSFDCTMVTSYYKS